MPELPEVETVVRGLARCVRDLTIEEAVVMRRDILRPGSLDQTVLAGARVAGVERAGKNVVLRLTPRMAVVVNLGMTGKLLFHGPGGCSSVHREPHLHAAIRFSSGGVLCYHDARRFGSILITRSRDIPAHLRIGQDPFRMGARDFHELLKGRRATIKAVLLNQKHISGLGNIYVDEALFRAGVHPATPSWDAAKRARLILTAARTVLKRAIRRGGTTVRDYRTHDGSIGSFQHELAVYGRTGRPCIRCGTPIQKTIVAGRGTHFCPVCQRV